MATPRFVSEAYFMDFKFEAGNYYLAGREQLDGHQVLRVEYYPTHMFNDEPDHDNDDDDDKSDKKADGKKKPPKRARASAGGGRHQPQDEQDGDGHAVGRSPPSTRSSSTPSTTSGWTSSPARGWCASTIFTPR